MSRLAACLWAATLLPSAAFAAQDPGLALEERHAPHQGEIYAKKATWADTMAATRANYLVWLADANKAQGAGDFTPWDSGSVAGDGPGAQVSVNVAGLRVMRLVATLEHGGGNCHIWGDARLIDKAGKETRLSTLKPLAVTVGWGQLLRDKNWENHPLQIGERKFQHGIWVHSNSDVAYLLDGQYERFEAWVGMDAHRATGVARFQVLSGTRDILPALWQRLAADFPAQAAWLTKDLARGQHLAWFGDRKGPQLEYGTFNRVVVGLGASGEPLRREIADLLKAAPAGDARWLDLYARACAQRDVLAAVATIRLAPVRQAMEKDLAALAAAKTPADDSRWRDLAARAARYGQSLAALGDIDLATLRPSIEALATAFPRRYADKDALLRQVAENEQLWAGLADRVLKGDEAALQQVPELRDKVAGLWQAIRLGYASVQEMAAAPPAPEMVAEWQAQFATLQADLANKGHFARVAPEAHRPKSLIAEADRDPADVVLRRTAALLAHLKSNLPQVANLREVLAGLEQQVADLQAASARIDPACAAARYALYTQACRIRRQAAFANPLLSFDKLLFIKHHRSLYSHMCDQYYGITAHPGGGLYILKDPFGPKPTVQDVLANSVVEKGRLKGQKLLGGPPNQPRASYDGGGGRSGPEAQGGSFLSPDLSFDARQIAFAFVECKGRPTHESHTDASRGHWDPGWAWHIFKVNTDGTGLEQLTDGTFNDFDPCWLPNGRIAFISERRGGYLRCGRVCPTYTLYDMAADGSDMRCLSPHETNEWHPSVTHDGRIIYTRWDYVDRHGCTAHLPWITTLDGRDSRAVHGNFAPRNARPDMEVDIRAIPNSHKFVATAAPHHGQAYGSLVLIDPRTPDDDAMGPIRRLTPEVGFPESQGGQQVYGTAWPLSEDFYLCVYDSLMRGNAALQGSSYLPGNYGIYLVDSFGNKELLYRDPDIACLSPIPLVPRPKPLETIEIASPHRRTTTAPHLAEGNHAKPEATLTVLNVYDSRRPWPEGTKITALRVLQVLPMSVPSGGPPHETGVRLPEAGDSVVPCRYVLGTVPVEADGSAHFTVPANVELFFQALDERGLAVQSMRSATYLLPGERLSCQGCHETQGRAPDATRAAPLALRREPSKLTPDVDGSNPFSYPRLVQPVLDRNCVPCHTKNKDKGAPNLTKEPLIRNWYASYNTLVRYGYTTYKDGYRTTPGQFGARGSKLFEMLEKGHHDLKLSAEDFRRLTLWLDCVSMFYGVFEKEGGQVQLTGGIAKPTLE
ncbi:MAG TPA: NPCBM/NEW2 domain-containing protein [Planctomycetota bacterium]|nr:NPCBM/NEW2 domain-containing protein [Planctomycetota bacterium]HRR80546.1 NPCBM/NEW2 domain-containing protein [Planctomycetota bacterium]HRT93295.1 NPCBM/NEW2 domain-containing protein [Planctomycetota bacterium]